MNKSKWLVVTWLGLWASAGAFASNAVGDKAESAPRDGGQATIVAEASGSHIESTAVGGFAHATGGDAKIAGKGSSFLTLDTGSAPVPMTGALILAGLGALGVAAARRRHR